MPAFGKGGDGLDLLDAGPRRFDLDHLDGFPVDREDHPDLPIGPCAVVPHRRPDRRLLACIGSRHRGCVDGEVGRRRGAGPPRGEDHGAGVDVVLTLGLRSGGADLAVAVEVPPALEDDAVGILQEAADVERLDVDVPGLDPGTAGCIADTLVADIPRAFGIE